MPESSMERDDEGLRQLLRASFEHSRRVIGLATPEQSDLPTPCTLFDVGQLVGHMIFAAQRVGAAGRRGDMSEQGEVPSLKPADWEPVFAEAADDALAAWSAPTALEGDIVLPFGTFPAAVVAKMYILEQATHAWDLATAIGAGDSLDDSLAESALPFAQEIVVAEFRGDEPMPFGAEVQPEPGARPYDRLAAFMGRRPPAS
jgi:uncharacterized protein (TIGR03086 family)